MTDTTNKMKLTKKETQPKGRPFKKFYCDRDDIFLLPPLAFKLWMFYYRSEGAKRESWASRDVIVAKCGMDKDTVTKWRDWLVKNNWLRKIGEHRTPGHFFGVPVMQVTRGTIPAVLSRHGTSAASTATRFQRRENPVTVSDGKTQSHAVTGTAGFHVTGKPSSPVTGKPSAEVDVRTEVDKTEVDGSGQVRSVSLFGKSDTDQTNQPPENAVPPGLPTPDPGCEWVAVKNGWEQRLIGGVQ